MISHSLMRTEPNSRPLLISPSFIFSGCTANIMLHVIADVLSDLNNPFIFFYFFFLKSLHRLINHLSAARKREITHKLLQSVDSKCVSASNVGSWGWVTPSDSGHPAPDSRPAPLPLSSMMEVEVSTTSCSTAQQHVRTQMCVKQHLLVVKATTS